MITEDYISFEVAKLLKEKGFDEFCRAVYIIRDERLVHCTRHNIFDFTNNERIKEVGDGDTVILAPTLQMTMKWLRDVHKLYIVVRPYVTEEGFFSLFDIKSIKEKEIVVNLRTKTGFNTYEEAAETAVRYCLENLI